MSLMSKPAAKKSVPSKKVEEKPAALPYLILGLDISLRHTGIVALSPSKDVLLKETLDNPKPKSEDVSKLGDYNRVVQYLKTTAQMLHIRHKCPLYIFREDYAYAAGSSSDTVLKELGGIVEWELVKSPWVRHYAAVPITSAKKFVSGKGDAEKDKVADGVFSLSKFEGDEHQVDAYSIAAVALQALVPKVYLVSAVSDDAAKTFAKTLKELGISAP